MLNLEELVSRFHRYWNNSGKAEKAELTFYMIWPAFTVYLAQVFELNYLSVVLVSFGVPSAVLFREIGERKHFLYFTTIITLALAPVLDYMGHASGTWFIHTSLGRIWRYVPLESLLWGFMIAFYSVGFYERYFREHNHRGFKRYFYPFHILAAISLIVIPFESLLPTSLYLPHLYFIGMIVVFLLPAIEYLYVDNANHTGVWLTTIYFWYALAMHEIAVLLNNVWWFPLGENAAVLGTVNLLNHAVPYEELTLYFWLTAPGLIAYYELLSKREDK